MNTLRNPASKPWFREPWPWLLASGPLLVVVASLVSAWVAIKSDDGLISEDYYRQGLAAQETVARSDRAVALGLTAHLRLSDGRLNLKLSAKDPRYSLPPALRITLSHPTRAGLDQNATLVLGADGYTGHIDLPRAGHWLILIEDTSQQWRMMGSVVLPVNDAIVIGEATVKSPQ